MILIEYALLISPTLVHLLVDLKGKVRHKLNAAYVLGLSVAIGLCLPGYWWQGALYALCIHLTFFDPFYNLTHGHPLFYHGSSKNPSQALTDKAFIMAGPFMEVVIRGFSLLIGYSFYYQLDQIFHYLP